MKLINKIKFKVLTIFIIILLSNKLHSRALKPKNVKNKQDALVYTKEYIKSVEEKIKSLRKIKFKLLPDCNRTVICLKAINNLCDIEDKTLLEILNVIFNQRNKKKSNTIEKIIQNIKEVNKHNNNPKNTKEISILEKNLNMLNDEKVIQIYSEYLRDIVDSSLNFNNFNLEKKNLCKNENSNILAVIAAYITKKLTFMKYVSLNTLLKNKNSKELNNIAYYIRGDNNLHEFGKKYKNRVLISPQPLLFNIKTIKAEYGGDNKYLQSYDKELYDLYEVLIDKSEIYELAFKLDLKSKPFKDCYGYITKENNIILPPYSYYKVSFVKEYNNKNQLKKDSIYPAVFVDEIKIECLRSLNNIKEENIINTIHQINLLG